MNEFGIPRMELSLDLGNYDVGTAIFKRTAARGIIRHDDNYLLIYSEYGDYKFPGGGVEANESYQQALVREVQEETGYVVIPESIRYLGVVHERRKSDLDDIMEMDSHYFFCDVEKIAGSRNLDEYEEEYNYQIIWVPLETALKNNQKGVDLLACPWVIREIKVMEFLINSGS